MISLEITVGQLQDALELARRGQDPEGVHQVRVLTRKIRVWLELAGYRVLQDDLRWLGRGVGEIRDLEVLLQTPELPTAFRKWVSRRLEQARLGLAVLFSANRLEALLEALQVLPSLEKTVALGGLKKIKQRVAKKAQTWETKGDYPHLHALRRALRKLRYGREWLGEDSQSLKKLQEVFGMAGDLAFTQAYLRQFQAERGGKTPRFAGQIAERLEVALIQARDAWEKYTL